jgi:aminoglycoside phosphotransferase (APT) family kinase protein
MNWLDQNTPEETGNRSLVHGDWRIDNLLFHKKQFKLIAILDWELSTLGDPRADIASQIMQWSMPKGDEGRGLAGVNRSELGIPEDNEFVEQYSEHMGLSNLPDLEFPIAFCYFRMAAILQGVKKRALDGNASDPDRAIKMGQYVIEFAKKALERLKI